MAEYVAPCPHCGHQITFPAAHQPGPGEAIECGQCQGVGMYTERAALRKPTVAETLLIELWKQSAHSDQGTATTPPTLAAHPQTLTIDQRIKRAKTSRYN